MMNVNNYEFCIDYIGVRIDCPSLAAFWEHVEKGLLKPNDFLVPGKPLRFYQYGVRLNGTRIFSFEYSLEGEEGDVIWMNGENGAYGIFCEFSGDGIRYFGINKILCWLGEMRALYDIHCTRIDLAMDVFDPSNTIIPTILIAADNKLCCSDEGIKIYKARKVRKFENMDKYRNCKSVSVEIGSRGGNFVRCYDKWLEQAEKSYTTPDDLPEYWYRLEVEVRPGGKVSGFCYEYADECLLNVLDGCALHKVFLRHLCRCFVIKSTLSTYDNGHSDYTENCLEWSDFVTLLENDNFTQSGETSVYKEYLRYYPVKNPQEQLRNYKNFLFTLLLMNDPEYIDQLFTEYETGMRYDSPEYRKYRKRLYGDMSEDDPMRDFLLYNPFGFDSKFSYPEWRQ